MTTWQEYEREIEAQFRALYPRAQITADAKILGKFSKVERQIDLLIEETDSAFPRRIVVDAKHWTKKIDVSDAECFLGLARDVEAGTGIMVALQGYTQAAVNRVHYDDTDMILDVLNLAELKAHQGEAAIPYFGEHGVSIAAPFGWVIDAIPRPGTVATLYQRGLTIENAVKNGEFMYVAFWDKKKHPDVDTLEKLLEFQQSYMLEGSPEAEIKSRPGPTPQREGARTLIRRLSKKDSLVVEITGFVDFEDFVFMGVLFTPEKLERKNQLKLDFILRDAFRIDIEQEH
jgi:hypothetical protein